MWKGQGTRYPAAGRSPGCPKVPSITEGPPEQSLRVCRGLPQYVLLALPIAAPLCTSPPWLGRGMEGLRIPLCGMERIGKQGGGEPRVRGLQLTSRESCHWLSSQGLRLRRELPAPHHSLPLPPQAPWLLSLPAGPPPSQTAARGRGRSISEQRGPCGL